MATALFVKTVLSVPGVGEMVHYAELHEQTAEQCTLVRLVECDAHDEPRLASEPSTTVPHPRTYAAYQGLQTSYITEAEFRERWRRASEGTAG